ncbi:MAG TPA: ChuX/HutX family heme-like substrate-binding protein [Rhodanobacteraceae bacterium]|nr:ChuX/HutX family heme-like substrate-binding protein [Rhodanobacteraceae bacterium]
MLNESTAITTTVMPPAQLQQAWRELRTAEPMLRARDLAERLGVSEGELVASRCGDGDIVRLQGPWDELIRDLPALGRVMALTRNDSCVHEKKGEFDNIDLGPMMGVVLNEAIDLRIFLRHWRHWRHGYAVREESRGRTLESLQFFDGDGRAVHKVYLTDHSHREGWEQLLARFRAPEQSVVLEVREVADPLSASLDDAKVDVDALRAGWRAMRDPHDFFALMKKHKTTRLQALHLVGREFARKVANESVRHVFERAAICGLPLMVFVGSPGVVQIHTGPVHNIKTMGPWLNVLDDDFNLHLRADHIAESWVVDKPSPDGPVTSLELYDANGVQIAQVFGKRKPGTPQLPPWRALAESLSDAELAHA